MENLMPEGTQEIGGGRDSRLPLLELLFFVAGWLTDGSSVCRPTPKGLGVGSQAIGARGLIDSGSLDNVGGGFDRRLLSHYLETAAPES